MPVLLFVLGLFAVHQAQPTPPASHAAAPAVSPDGQWIAFTSDRDGTSQIYVIRPDGTGERRVTNSARPKNGAQWSGDGTHLFFAPFSDGVTHLFTVDLDGTNEHEVLSAPGRELRIAPDGKHALYSQGSYTDTELMLAEIDGARVVNPKRINPAGSIAWNVRWSPDGHTVAFTSRGDGKQLQVWLMNADGSHRRALTTVAASEGNAQLPAWSPDGTTIAFQVNGERGMGHIWVVDVASGHAHKVAAHSDLFLDELPVWFPDGTRLAFQSTRTGRWEVWTVNVDGTGLRQLTK